MYRKYRLWNIITSTCLFIISLLLVNCSSNDHLVLGLSVGLTGKYGDLGVQARDGALLAVETINDNGGIGGRLLQLEVRDDLGTFEDAQRVDQELVEAGAVAIIGHITSQQTLAAYPITESANVVLFSPTASTPELSGRKDHFFRLVAPNPTEGQVLAQHIYQNRGLARAAVVYETDNQAFSSSLLDSFSENYSELGGQLTHTLDYSSSGNPDFADLVKQLQASNSTDALLIIAPPVDAALIAQRIRIADWPVPLFATAWSQSQELISKGGKAVEGIEIPLTYDPSNQTSIYRDFQTRYQERFGQEPSLYAGITYDVVFILAKALEKTGGEGANLAEALVGTEIEGVGGIVSLDEYGEVIRDWFLLTVQDGEYVTADKLRVQVKNLEIFE